MERCSQAASVFSIPKNTFHHRLKPLLLLLKMGRKCCVTNCDGNYDKDKKEKTFRLPRKQEERERWLAVIPRDNKPDKNDIVVCERHWPLGYPTLHVYGKERPLNPPSVFLTLTKLNSFASCSSKAHFTSSYQMSYQHAKDNIGSFKTMKECCCI